ncbi:MAG: Mur ligase family protein, partial [Armatimonadota bacterium]|nr:Mur ligase family protein [Armatimonadota bacterium]
LVSVITNIGLDHTELLGHTLTEIAGEKAGIVKPGVSCVTGVPLDGEADAVICRVCRERDAALSHIVQGKRSGVGDTSYQTSKDGTLAIETPYRTLERLRLRLHGTFQHANAAVAVAGLDAVSEDQLPRLSDQSVRQGLESAWLPGRLEQISERPTVVVDVAHNELSAQALADALRDTFAAERRRLIFVVGLSRHHEPGPFLAPLAALEPAALIATEPTFRSRPAKDVALAARQHDIKKVETIVPVSDAARRALSLAGPDDLICVTGSFYTVGDLPPTLWTELLRERNS